ncbi:hypothetical protein EJ04DRAFT_233045 [Polyplosphaeria fusca]|uniref:Uncharacterized protein n=1 Tax=Polyplosphaeria fusca TaxID=682080 RepID=A0A9P4RA65_9PLEO|nr:hypothetical protein EJ04DRAFT_233045 [Polyplosphaeria fusca]
MREPAIRRKPSPVSGYQPTEVARDSVDIDTNASHPSTIVDISGPLLLHKVRVWSLENNEKIDLYLQLHEEAILFRHTSSHEIFLHVILSNVFIQPSSVGGAVEMHGIITEYAKGETTSVKSRRTSRIYFECQGLFSTEQIVNECKKRIVPVPSLVEPPLVQSEEASRLTPSIPYRSYYRVTAQKLPGMIEGAYHSWLLINDESLTIAPNSALDARASYVVLFQNLKSMTMMHEKRSSVSLQGIFGVTVDKLSVQQRVQYRHSGEVEELRFIVDRKEEAPEILGRLESLREKFGKGRVRTSGDPGVEPRSGKTAEPESLTNPEGEHGFTVLSGGDDAEGSDTVEPLTRGDMESHGSEDKFSRRQAADDTSIEDSRGALTHLTDSELRQLEVFSNDRLPQSNLRSVSPDPELEQEAAPLLDPESPIEAEYKYPILVRSLGKVPYSVHVINSWIDNRFPNKTTLVPGNTYGSVVYLGTYHAETDLLDYSQILSLDEARPGPAAGWSYGKTEFSFRCAVQQWNDDEKRWRRLDDLQELFCSCATVDEAADLVGLLRQMWEK